MCTPYQSLSRTLPESPTHPNPLPSFPPFLPNQKSIELRYLHPPSPPPTPLAEGVDPCKDGLATGQVREGRTHMNGNQVLACKGR